MEVGELVVERLFDVVESVVVLNDVGGAVISCVSSGRSAGDEAEVVRGGKVGFECIPSAVDGGFAFPFGECLAVETRDLKGHDGHVHHLCHCVWWRGDDGGDKTVFEAVEVGFDGVCWIPRGTKECVVGLFFGRSRAAVEGAERKQDGAWIVVVAVGTGAHDGTGGVGAAFEFFWHRNVEGVDDGLRHVELGEVFHFRGVVDGFSVAGELGVKANAAVRAGIGCVHPGCGGFHGVFRRLLGKATISPFIGLGRLDRLELVEEVAFEGPNVAVVRAWVECWEVSDCVRGHCKCCFVCWRSDGRLNDGRREDGGGHWDGGRGQDCGGRRDVGSHGGVDVCRGLRAKESSSSIEQKQKRLEINDELDDL